MKKCIFTFLFFCVSIFQLAAQYTTPNTGVDWTLDDIAIASPTTITISGSTYTLLENITVSVNDILRIPTNLTLQIEAGLRITVFGSFLVEANATTITAVNQANPYDGFRFEEFSVINIQNATIEYGGGLQVLTEDFILNNSILQFNIAGVATGGVVAFSRGIPEITNNQFLFNATPAISSAANTQVSAYIFNNYLEGNNQTNNNRPQINMGATRTLDTLKIIQNTIIGDRTKEQVGGIAVANLVGGALRVIIEDNIIKDNRYGMTIVGPNAFGRIKNNIIEDNNTQNNPNLGGSGINLNAPTGGQEIVASGNKIRRNLWGVTLQGQSNANFGDDQDNPGLNVFSENGNSGEIFALYNNTPNVLSAKNNCWVEGGEGTLAEAETVIFHQVDDPSLGEVIFDPINCEILGLDEITIKDFVFYPNPATNSITFDNVNSFEKLEIFGMQGNVISSQKIVSGTNRISLSLPSGIYFTRFSNEKSQVIKKLLVK